MMRASTFAAPPEFQHLVREEPPSRAERTRSDYINRKITVVAKENPDAAGSKRVKWFAALKSGMTVTEAVARGVRSTYLQRMHARGVIKLS
jgi:hypothetical protein